MTKTVEALQSIIRRLKDLKLAPAQIDHSKLGEFSIANAYREINSQIISGSVTTGFDRNLDLAVLKAVVEWTERQAFEHGFRTGQRACQTKRSDGFAAFPTSTADHVQRARTNALAEATERFVWAYWWDHPEVAYQITKRRNFADTESNLFGHVEKLNRLSQVFKIEPTIANPNGIGVAIYFAELKQGGFVSGGAAGSIEDRDGTETRAIGELLRHAHAANLIREGQTPTTFYERRLAHFLTKRGVRQVMRRLSISGNQSIVLPKLQFDESIRYPAENVVYVHRCLFENQPPFVGGELERLCL